jgi:hypothetical protein
LWRFILALRLIPQKACYLLYILDLKRGSYPIEFARYSCNYELQVELNVRLIFFFENTPWKVYQSHRRKAKTAGTTPLHDTTLHHDTTPSGKQQTLNTPDDKRLFLPNILPRMARRGAQGFRTASRTKQDNTDSISAPRQPRPTYLPSCA